MTIDDLEPETASSSGSAVGSHGEGLCPQSCCVISCRRPLYTPSHNQPQVCCLQAKGNHQGTSRSPPLTPGPDSILFRDFQQLLGIREPGNSLAPASAGPWTLLPQSVLAVLHLRLYFPTPSGASTCLYSPAPAQHGEGSNSCFPKALYPMVEQMQDPQPYRNGRFSKHISIIIV